MKPARNLAGQRFGAWLVLERSPKRNAGDTCHWLCRCACGRERHVSSKSLRYGKSTRCRACAYVANGRAQRAAVGGPVQRAEWLLKRWAEERLRKRAWYLARSSPSYRRRSKYDGEAA